LEKAEYTFLEAEFDNNAKGGDIDENKENVLKKKIKASVELEEIFYLPVDIVVHYDFNRFIEKNFKRN